MLCWVRQRHPGTWTAWRPHNKTRWLGPVHGQMCKYITFSPLIKNHILVQNFIFFTAYQPTGVCQMLCWVRQRAWGKEPWTDGRPCCLRHPMRQYSKSPPPTTIIQNLFRNWTLMAPATVALLVFPSLALWSTLLPMLPPAEMHLFEQIQLTIRTNIIYNSDKHIWLFEQIFCPKTICILSF